MNPLLDRFDFPLKLCFKKNTVPEEVLSEEYCNFIQRNQYANTNEVDFLEPNLYHIHSLATRQTSLSIHI